jgi:ribosome-binding factor A
MSNRNIRVSELLKREVSEILHTRYQRESVAITITGVDVSPDHSQGIVFYSLLVDQSGRWASQRFLDRVAGKIRHEVGKRIVLKRIPALRFEFDEALSQGYRVNEIIDSLELADDQRED